MREALWSCFLLNYHLTRQPVASYPFSKRHPAVQHPQPLEREWQRPLFEKTQVLLAWPQTLSQVATQGALTTELWCWQFSHLLSASYWLVLGGPSHKGLVSKDNGRRLTRLSSILMRASNSCSPSRLFRMGPKVPPAHCTEPTSWGRCFSCSSRMRFSTPPALDRADTCGNEQKAVSSHTCVCVYTHNPCAPVRNREWGSGKVRNRNLRKTELYLAFSSQRKAAPNLWGMCPFPRKKVLVFLS